jgi:NADPH:quinone reductase-like Zn-dependent oxidoreductase
MRAVVYGPGSSAARGWSFQIPPQYAKKDVLLLKELIEAGRYRPVIDRCYPLEQVVEATRYVETEQKTGNVVLTVGGDRGA